MSASSVSRFSIRAHYYSKYRPGYPRGIIGVLQKETDFDEDHVVADIGSGTGLLSRVFLENGNKVFGIEPSDRMRSKAEDNLHLFRNFVSIDATAENTTLPDQSVDLVTVGQALHWFDPMAAAREFSRISRDGGSLCVAYNENRRGSKLMRAYQEITDRNENPEEVPEVDSRYAARFFEGGEFSKVVLKNDQRLDYEGLLGRLLSGSRMPAPRERERIRKLKRDTRVFFDTFQSAGALALLYDTRLYIGRVSRAR